MRAFFFFQAEDGIRDLTVTGVQTCALPISTVRDGRAAGVAGARCLGGHPVHRRVDAPLPRLLAGRVPAPRHARRRELCRQPAHQARQLLVGWLRDCLDHPALFTARGQRRLTPSNTHLVLIPSYNPGRRGVGTVRAARAHWAPVWVIVDGSTDGSGEAFAQLARGDPQLRVLVRARNGGKGAALLEGLIEAQRAGLTHALAMDCDCQHPAQCIGAFMAASIAAPEAMILGEPVFDASAPRVRLRGHRIANWCTNLETLWAGIHDTLFGFRVYPI